jgi:hypothetical protein
VEGTGSGTHVSRSLEEGTSEVPFVNRSVVTSFPFSLGNIKGRKFSESPQVHSIRKQIGFT